MGTEIEVRGPGVKTMGGGTEERLRTEMKWSKARGHREGCGTGPVMGKGSRKKRGCPKTRFRIKTVRRGAAGMAGGPEEGAGQEQRLRKQAGPGRSWAEQGRAGRT